MKFFVKIITILFLQQALIVVGEKPSKVVLSASKGYIFSSKKQWSSASLVRATPTLLMYLDPDNEADNLNLEQNLQEHFEGSSLKVIGAINMKSSWLPNFGIYAKLNQRKKKHKEVTFVIDKKRILEKTWGLKSGVNHTILFDRNGTVAFYHKGKFSTENLKQLNKVINTKLSN